jgi:hypothetical protein
VVVLRYRSKFAALLGAAPGSSREGWLAVGLNARGAVEIVFATVGLSIGG